METPTHTAPPVALDRLVRRDKGWEQSEIENAELRQYAAHALELLNKLEYEREEDGQGELVATLDLDWFFHVKRRLEKILISLPNANVDLPDTATQDSASKSNKPAPAVSSHALLCPLKSPNHHETNPNIYR